MADEPAPKRKHFKCPDCDKVSYFKPDEPRVCKQCGFGAEVEAPEASGLAITSVITGAIALLTVFFSPFSLIFALAALVTGGMALSESDRDQPLAAVGLVLGGIGLLMALMFLLWVPVNASYTSGGSYEGGSGGSVEGGSGGGGSGGGGGGSGGGGGGSGGGGGGGSGGGGGGIGGGGDVGAPGVPFWLAALGLGLTAWRRRA